MAEKIYMCSNCGRELKGEAATGIEDEIRILLSGSDDKSLLNKAWFTTVSNKRKGIVYCFSCIAKGAGVR